MAQQINNEHEGLLKEKKSVFAQWETCHITGPEKDLYLSFSWLHCIRHMCMIVGSKDQQYKAVAEHQMVCLM
jgi:hypothetical protein